MLHPKVAGVAAALDALRGELDALYDVTLGYADHARGERPSEWSLLAWRAPREVHVHVERKRLAELPSHSERAVSGWLRPLWARKEALLARFAERGRFAERALGSTAAATLERRARRAYALAAVFWAVACGATVVALARARAPRWWVLGAALAYGAVTAACTGLDVLEVCWGKRSAPRALAVKHARAGLKAD